jgi:hypothetical protein
VDRAERALPEVIARLRALRAGAAGAGGSAGGG